MNLRMRWVLWKYFWVDKIFSLFYHLMKTNRTNRMSLWMSYWLMNFYPSCCLWCWLLFLNYSIYINIFSSLKTWLFTSLEYFFQFILILYVNYWVFNFMFAMSFDILDGVFCEKVIGTYVSIFLVLIFSAFNLFFFFCPSF